MKTSPPLLIKSGLKAGNIMKKGFMLGLMFFGMLGICSQASAENIFAGKVAASNTSVISAPYGGRVDNIYVHVGDYVGEDSLIATIGNG